MGMGRAAALVVSSLALCEAVTLSPAAKDPWHTASRASASAPAPATEAPTLAKVAVPDIGRPITPQEATYEHQYALIQGLEGEIMHLSRRLREYQGKLDAISKMRGP